MDMSNVTGPVAPDLLKALVILSDKLSEGLQLTKIHTENQKKGHISQGDQDTYYLQAF